MKNQGEDTYFDPGISCSRLLFSADIASRQNTRINRINRVTKRLFDMGKFYGCNKKAPAREGFTHSQKQKNFSYPVVSGTKSSTP